MGENPPLKREDERPIDVQSVPEEEDLSAADADERLDEDPHEQRNRPDQPGVSAEERKQFNDPEVEIAGPEGRPSADRDHSEDR
jgi:hypothetical protein